MTDQGGVLTPFHKKIRSSALHLKQSSYLGCKEGVSSWRPGNCWEKYCGVIDVAKTGITTIEMV